MQRVDVRELRAHAAQHLASDGVLAIERRGLPIGRSIPTGKRRQAGFQEALARLEQTVRQVLAETGMSGDELARLFDLHEPLPEGREAPARARPPGH